MVKVPKVHTSLCYSLQILLKIDNVHIHTCTLDNKSIKISGMMQHLIIQYPDFHIVDLYKLGDGPIS